ncbi:MAG: hypothetical protein MH208_20580 [Marinobacter sp.]|nr:hypothetical protein [Marinobacter sp.]
MADVRVVTTMSLVIISLSRPEIGRGGHIVERVGNRHRGRDRTGIRNLPDVSNEGELLTKGLVSTSPNT